MGKLRVLSPEFKPLPLNFSCLCVHLDDISPLQCRDLRTVRKTLGKKVLVWVKPVFLGQEVQYCMVYIAYYTELNLQIGDYAQKRRIWCENCKYALDENFHSYFCSRPKAAKFCHPAQSLHWMCSTFLRANRWSIQCSDCAKPGACNSMRNFFRDIL